MNIVHVYPLASLPRGIGHSFAYFTAQELPRGALVEVEIGRRYVPALVARVENVESLKSALKRADWQTKRVRKILSASPLILEQFFVLAEWAHNYFLVPPGLFLKQFIPAAILRNSLNPTFNDPHACVTSNVGPVRATLNVGRIPQARIRTAIGTREDRARLWANEAREALARHQSLFLITSTAEAAAYFAALLSCLPRQPLLLTGEMTAKRLRRQWQEIREEKDGVVVVGTPMVIGALRADTTTVIIDDASSSHFWRRESPFIYYTRALEQLSILFPFSLWKGRRVASLADVAFPAGATYVSPRRKTIRSSFIDLRDNTSPSSSARRKRVFSLFSREIIERINHAPNKRVICFVNHRGYGTMLLCKDCAAPIPCPSCAIPLRLHKEPPMLACHHCGFRKAISDRCPKCGSWNIEVYGIGIERVEEAARAQFPHRPIFRLDAAARKKKKEREETRRAFLASADGILLATELFLEDYYLFAPLLICPSLDFLFLFPDLNLRERFLRLLAELGDRARDEIIIQTFSPDHAFFKAFGKGDTEGVLREEMEHRRRAQWPPFSLLVKITASYPTPEESKDAVERLAAAIKKIPRESEEPMAMRAYPAFIPKEKTRWRHHLLLRVNQARWADAYHDLKKILLALDSSFSVIIDPSSTL